MYNNPNTAFKYCVHSSLVGIDQWNTVMRGALVKERQKDFVLACGQRQRSDLKQKRKRRKMHEAMVISFCVW
jgi:hypothetical protein